jgi:hypothetical protein
MPTFSISDFKNGLDLRKSYATAPAGSLRVLRNAFLTPGAEIEKRTKFQFWYNAPVPSHGLLSRNGVVYVIKDGASGISEPSGTTPGIITLPPPSSGVDHMTDWDLFNGKFYIVQRAVDGTLHHYYDQVPVTDAMATSSSIRTFGGKMYGVDGRLLRGSAINDPTHWTPPSDSTLNDGSFYIDLSAQDSDSTNLIGLEVYYGQLAVFSELSTQFWQVNADPTQNQFKQLLRGTGLMYHLLLTQWGNGDIMYLGPHGVRSLRVQNQSLTAGSTDVGTPVDELLSASIRDQPRDWFQTGRCLIQPRTGRLWVVLPDNIYVLSTYQEPAITAWSTFDAPFGFVEACIADPYVAIRGDDHKIYKYGGDADDYDSTEAEVITPALACDNPSKMKRFHSFDVGGEGTWTMSVGCDPNAQATEEDVATFTGSTYMQNELTMPEVSTHISLRFRSTDASRARLGNVTLMYDDGSTD